MGVEVVEQVVVVVVVVPTNGLVRPTFDNFTYPLVYG